MSKILKFSSYTPSRGGHAPGDVRAAFLSAIEAYEAWEAGAPEPSVEVREQHVTISRVCGLVWNCTDIMPAAACQSLWNLAQRPGVWSRVAGVPAQGWTYAYGARLLKALVASAVADMGADVCPLGRIADAAVAVRLGAGVDLSA